MSKSVTLYRVSQSNFKKLEMSKGTNPFDSSYAKSFIILDQASGLEKILLKGKSDSEMELISEIFCTGRVIGLEEFEALSFEDRFEFLAKNEIISYLDIDTIVGINRLINTISQEEISLNFNAEEMNAEEIYGINWHTNNSPDLKFNVNHIIDGFSKLQLLFNDATLECDYIIVDDGENFITELHY